MVGIANVGRHSRWSDGSGGGSRISAEEPGANSRKGCDTLLLLATTKFVAKVMFLLVSVIMLMGGCYPSMHCRWYPSMPCSRSPGGVPGLGGAWSGGCLVWGVPGLGGAWSGGVPGGVACSWGGAWSRGHCLLPGRGGCVTFCYGLLLWSSVMPFCYGLLVWWPSD